MRTTLRSTVLAAPAQLLVLPPCTGHPQDRPCTPRRGEPGGQAGLLQRCWLQALSKTVKGQTNEEAGQTLSPTCMGFYREEKRASPVL